eukprot:c9858_g1_i1.p1 GENE.c9858_g1_i1~~c9858_g1_i1.p1  ORF type:complete len:182 (+),score=31.34 c9858_g1_i1:579-1124(+)
MSDPSSSLGAQAAQAQLRCFVDRASPEDVLTLMRSLVEAKGVIAGLRQRTSTLQGTNKALVARVTALSADSLRFIEENRRLRAALLAVGGAATADTVPSAWVSDGASLAGKKRAREEADAALMAPPPAKRARALNGSGLSVQVPPLMPLSAASSELIHSDCVDPGEPGFPALSADSAASSP